MGDTLFDPSVYQRNKILAQWTDAYSLGIERLARETAPSFHTRELAIFNEVARSESMLVESETLLMGPLTVRINRGPTINLLNRRKPISIRGWVEQDRVEFPGCDAKGILLVEKATHLALVSRMNFWRKSNLILATGNGIPSVGTRRVLYRLQRDFDIPIYLLADNDTWGCFLFSVLKRGSIAPHIKHAQLAVNNIRFLGLRAGDSSILVGRFAEHWQKRIRAMSKYPCFRSRAWQHEFKAFLRQRRKIELDAFSVQTAHYLNELFARRIQDGDWLV